MIYKSRDSRELLGGSFEGGPWPLLCCVPSAVRQRPTRVREETKGFLLEKDMKQNEMILQHLKEHNVITPAEAYGKYGVFRLSARILELKQQGHKIITSIIKKTGRRGTKRFAEYRLVKAAKVAA